MDGAAVTTAEVATGKAPSRETMSDATRRADAVQSARRG
jgi:uncharacterized protein GlcG (DUF336 family)